MLINTNIYANYEEDIQTFQQQLDEEKGKKLKFLLHLDAQLPDGRFFGGPKLPGGIVDNPYYTPTNPVVYKFPDTKSMLYTCIEQQSQLEIAKPITIPAPSLSGIRIEPGTTTTPKPQLERKNCSLRLKN